MELGVVEAAFTMPSGAAAIRACFRGGTAAPTKQEAFACPLWELACKRIDSGLMTLSRAGTAPTAVEERGVFRW